MNNESIRADELISLTVLQIRLGLKDHQIKQAIASGLIPIVKLGGKPFVNGRDFIRATSNTGVRNEAAAS